jgi:hypothetical protein
MNNEIMKSTFCDIMSRPITIFNLFNEPGGGGVAEGGQAGEGQLFPPPPCPSTPPPPGWETLEKLQT